MGGLQHIKRPGLEALPSQLDQVACSRFAGEHIEAFPMPLGS